jgi:hypothetical protein
MRYFAEAFETIKANEDYNPNLIALIPVKETESWMLVDKNLLKEKIGTTLSNTALGLTYKISRVESIADPKGLIESAIVKYQNSLAPKRRRYAPCLADLYDILGSEVSILELEKLKSFSFFKNNFYEVLESIVNE